MTKPPTASIQAPARSRVIFMDVDGVLCSMRAHLALGYPKGQRVWHEWDPVAVETFKLACCKDVRIVVSSTWRHERHQPTLFENLDRYGMRHLLRQPEWLTKDLAHFDSMTRGHEIKEYLERNPDIVSYRIVDDMPDMLPSQHPYFIHTDTDNGMSTENIRSLLRWSGYLKS